MDEEHSAEVTPGPRVIGYSGIVTTSDPHAEVVILRNKLSRILSFVTEAQQQIRAMEHNGWVKVEDAQEGYNKIASILQSSGTK